MYKSFTESAINDNNGPVALGLALQGGGAYGAFTKGALKALLESGIITDRRAEIKAVTGTSAGAMNGIMLVHGLNTEGPTRAIKNLDALWDEAGSGMRTLKRLTYVFNPVAYPVWKMTIWPNLPKIGMDMTFAAIPKGVVVGQLSNSVDRIVQDWAPVQNGPTKLFINAAGEDANGERFHHVFKGPHLTKHAAAAAGSLEALGAYEIGGVKYYDGGYLRNPDFDDIEREAITDLMVITIMENPKGDIMPVCQDDLRAQHTRPGREVMKSELHHHLAWMRENRQGLNLHVVGLTVDPSWNDTSRMNTDPSWLGTLEEMGREAMTAWIAEHADKLGCGSSYQSPCAKGAPAALQCAM